MIVAHRSCTVEKARVKGKGEMWTCCTSLEKFKEVQRKLKEREKETCGKRDFSIFKWDDEKMGIVCKVCVKKPKFGAKASRSDDMKTYMRNHLRRYHKS